jgi:hypothetical protein
MKLYTLKLAMPGCGRCVVCRYASRVLEDVKAWAASQIRRYATSRGVSPLAVEWSLNA